MKKMLACFLAAAMMMSLMQGCKRNNIETLLPTSGEISYAEDQTLRMLYQYESYDLASAAGYGLPAEGMYAPSCTEPLLMLDQYGNLVYGLADDYTVNEAFTEYTFHIREGVYWVNHKGEKTDELTAEDFVTTAKINCRPGSSSSAAFFYQGIVKNASEYIQGKIEDFSEVGFTAVDRYTLKIKLTSQIPYFIDNCTNFVPYPTARYNELGEEYGNSVDKVYSIGAFYISQWQPEFQRIYLRNPHYWDAENVHIQRVELTFNAEADILAPELYKRGQIDVTSVSTVILSDWLKDEATKNTAIPMTDSSYSCYYSFCYAPNFGEEYEQTNYLKAIDNENFRQSLYWGFDRCKARMVTVPLNMELYLSSTVTPNGWCGVDGKDYTEFEELKGVTSRDNFSFDETKALAYKNAAVEELKTAGVTLPVKLLMPYNPNSDDWANEAQVVEQQLEALLGSDYIDIIVESGPALDFTQSVRNSGKYGFMRMQDGASVRDPANWVIAFQEGNNRTFLDKAQGENLKVLVAEYQKMLKEAWAIPEKSEARYAAYAKAEAFLLEHALVIPFSRESNGDYFISGRINPLEMVKGTSYSYKYMHVLEQPLTSEQYSKLYEQWLIDKEASKKNAIG